MAFGPVNAAGGATGPTLEDINNRIKAAKDAADKANTDLKAHEKAENPHNITPEGIDAVPTARKINGKPLSSDVTLKPEDIRSAPSGHTHNFSDLGGAVFRAGTAPPENTGLLWIDTTANTGGLKYFNGSAWVHVPVSTT